MFRLLCIHVGVVGSMAATANASVVVDFEEFSPGSTVVSGPGVFDDLLIVGNSTDESGLLTFFGGPPDNIEMRAEALTLVSFRFDVAVNGLTIDVRTSESVSTTFAFDVSHSGGVVDSFSQTVTPGSSYTTIDFSAFIDVTRVESVAEFGEHAYDNIAFTPVPAPGVLGGVGVVSLVISRRRR